MESSRTDFEVLGLGLEASSPRKLAWFFGMLKFCGALEKFFGKRFLVEIAWKIFVKTFFFFFFFFFGDRLKNFCEDLFFFFFESTCALCPWSLALASSIPVLGLESVCPRKGCPWPWPWPRIFFVSLALASSLVSSTPPLLARLYIIKYLTKFLDFCRKTNSLRFIVLMKSTKTAETASRFWLTNALMT